MCAVVVGPGTRDTTRFAPIRKFNQFWKGNLSDAFDVSFCSEIGSRAISKQEKSNIISNSFLVLGNFVLCTQAPLLPTGRKNITLLWRNDHVVQSTKL